MGALNRLIELALEKRGKIVDQSQQPAYCLWDLVWVVKDNNDWCAKLIWIDDVDELYRLQGQRGTLHVFAALDVPRDDFENDGRVREALKALRDPTETLTTGSRPEDDEVEAIPAPRRVQRQASGEPQGCGEAIGSWVIGIGLVVAAIGWVITTAVQLVLWIGRTPPALAVVVSLIVSFLAAGLHNGRPRLWAVLLGAVVGSAVGTALGGAAFALSGADSSALYTLRVASAFLCSGLFAAMASRFDSEAPRWWWPTLAGLGMVTISAGAFVTVNERNALGLSAAQRQQSEAVNRAGGVELPDFGTGPSGDANAMNGPAAVAESGDASPAQAAELGPVQPLRLERPARDPKAMGYERLYDLSEAGCDTVAGVGVVKRCQINVTVGEKYAWGSAWCATKSSAAKGLLGSTSFEYFIDGQAVSSSRFWVGKTPTCLRRRLLVTGLRPASNTSSNS
jgi:uncharacterized membrane protein HdeD (DUF308 family)